MKTIATAALAASTLLGIAAPATALSVASSNPITINQVAENPQQVGGSPGVVRISFTNKADVARLAVKS